MLVWALVWAAPMAGSQRPACGEPVQGRGVGFVLTPLETGLPRQGQWRDGFDLADMDGDGHPDLVHGPPRKGRGVPVIFLGDGKGRFQFWDSTHFPPLPYDYGDLKTADVNGDGLPDIALAAHLRGLTLLINEGRGSFAPWGAGLRLVSQDQAPEGLFTSRAIALTDWNCDRRPDLLALNEGPSRLASKARAEGALALFLNRGGFWQEVVPKQPLSLFGTALAVGDVNADGHPDAVLGTQVSGVRLLLMLGKGEGWTPRELRSLPPQAAVTAVAVHDFDRDRRGEILLGTRFIDGNTYCTALDWVHWTEEGETSVRLWSDQSRDALATFAIADFNRDGHDDLLAVREQGSLLLFSGGADGFQGDIPIPAPQWLSGCQAYQAQALDLDRDGWLEIIVSFAGERTQTGEPCQSGGGFAVWRVTTAP